MGNNVYGAIALKTSSGALDQIDGVNLLAGDIALVVTDTNSYFYKLFVNDVSQENSPYIIQPVLNGSNKRWKLTSISETSGDLNVVGKLITDMFAFSGNTLTIVTGSETLATFNKNSSSVSFKKISSVEDSTMVNGLNANYVGGRDGTKMMLSDGSVAFEAAVSGTTPTVPAHLTTKSYVDTLVASIDNNTATNLVVNGFINVNNIISDTDQNISIKPGGNTSVIFRTNGIVDLGMNSTNTNPAVKVSPVASQVNYFKFDGAAAANSPTFSVDGADTNVNMIFQAKGSGSTYFKSASISFSNINAEEQFRVGQTVGATSYLTAYGSTTAYPYLLSTGAAADISAALVSKGTGSVRLMTGGGEQFRVGNLPSAVNYLQATGAATDGYPAISALGADTNVGISFITKGVAETHFYSGGGEQFRVGHTASAVNFINIGGAVTGGAPTIRASGTDTNVPLHLLPKGASELRMFGSATNRFAIHYNQDTGNSILGPNSGVGDTYLRIGTSLGGVYAENARIAADGTFTAGGLSTSPAFKVTPTTNQVNYIQATGAVTGAIPGFNAVGSDSNVGFWLGTKGSGQVYLQGAGINIRGADTTPQFSISCVPSSANYLAVTGAATGGNPTFSAQGSDTNVGLAFVSKGTGQFVVYSQSCEFRARSDTTPQFQVWGIPGSVNFIQAAGAVPGAAPVFSAVGADTDVDLWLNPKGAGKIKFGTYTAKAAEVHTGYITIKDSSGTLRKVMVCA